MRKKNPPEWWDGLSKDKAIKSYIKADFSKFCEEDDPAYHGELSTAGYDEMGGMGGMGGMAGQQNPMMVSCLFFYLPAWPLVWILQNFCCC